MTTVCRWCRHDSSTVELVEESLFQAIVVFLVATVALFWVLAMTQLILKGVDLLGGLGVLHVCNNSISNTTCLVSSFTRRERRLLVDRRLV